MVRAFLGMVFDNSVGCGGRDAYALVFSKHPFHHNIESINEKGTWILVPRLMDYQVITSKRLLKRKLNPDQSLHCHKARLVAPGFN